MFMAPEVGKDLEVDVIAFADGGTTKDVRTVNGGVGPIGSDIALLYSRTKLPVKEFPRPGRAHAPPNDKAATITPFKCTLLAYNDAPDMYSEPAKYPLTPAQDLLKAIQELYPDRLSFAEGDTDGLRFDDNAVFYRISSYGGASGGGLCNDAGKLIGTTLTSIVLISQVSIREASISLGR
jgi:hypothetical protein